MRSGARACVRLFVAAPCLLAPGKPKSSLVLYCTVDQCGCTCRYTVLYCTVPAAGVTTSNQAKPNEGPPNELL